MQRISISSPFAGSAAHCAAWQTTGGRGGRMCWLIGPCRLSFHPCQFKSCCLRHTTTTTQGCGCGSLTSDFTSSAGNRPQARRQKGAEQS
jgi:hypothetical protein